MVSLDMVSQVSLENKRVEFPTFEKNKTNKQTNKIENKRQKRQKNNEIDVQSDVKIQKIKRDR